MNHRQSTGNTTELQRTHQAVAEQMGTQKGHRVKNVSPMPEA